MPPQVLVPSTLLSIKIKLVLYLSLHCEKNQKSLAHFLIERERENGKEKKRERERKWKINRKRNKEREKRMRKIEIETEIQIIYENKKRERFVEKGKGVRLRMRMCYLALSFDLYQLPFIVRIHLGQQQKTISEKNDISKRST